MTEDYKNFSLLFNRSTGYSRPDINPSSFETARVFIEALTPYHGMTVEDIFSEDEQINPQFSAAVWLESNIEGRRQLIADAYFRATQQSTQDLQELLFEQYEKLHKQPQNLAVAELLYGAELLEDLVTVLKDMRALARAYNAIEWDFVIFEATHLEESLKFQAINYCLYFSCVFPGEEE